MKFISFLPHLPTHHLLPLTRASEECGWDAVAVPDSVFYPETVSAAYPFSPDGIRNWGPDEHHPDPFVAIPAMAAVTQRISFFPNVLKTTLRHPLLVAKMAGSIASMFPGRFGLGLGLSWIPEEYEWLGVEMKTRGKRLDETIEIIRICTSPGWAEYSGKHYRFGRLVMAPVPPTAIPIYVGGNSDAALNRAARLGDGWSGVPQTNEDIVTAVAKLKAARQVAGRAEHPFEIIIPPPEMVTKDSVRRWEDLGVTGLTILPWLLYDGPQGDLQFQEDSLKRLADEVISVMR